MANPAPVSTRLVSQGEQVCSQSERGERGGRQRSQTSKEAVLKATLVQMQDVGVRRMTLEGIAAAAGVSKATIYRWWSSKGTLALDAFQSAFAALDSSPPPDTGSLRTDLYALFTMVLGSFERDDRDRILREIVAEAQSDTPLAEAIFAAFVEPYRAFHKPIFEAAIERGELRWDVDMPLVLDTLYGAYYHRLLLHHGDLSPAFFASVVDLLVDGLPRGSRGKP